MIRKVNGKVLVLENGSLASYELTVDSIILVTNGMKIKKGIQLQKFLKNLLKLKILQVDLPRVAELFEAQKTKRSCNNCRNFW